MRGSPAEILDVKSVAARAADIMETLTTMHKEQDDLLREVEALQATMQLAARRADRGPRVSPLKCLKTFKDLI